MLRLAAAASLLTLVAACACGGKPSTTPAPAEPGPAEPGPAEPGPTEPGPAAPAEPTIDLTQLGTPCGDGDRCSDGTTCVTYYGIAGRAGPEFKSCEIRCADKGAICPVGSSCTTIADGPGAVCRAVP